LLEKITYKEAVLIIEQLNTNSVPLKVMCNDGLLYIAKTVFKKHPPFEDLINEIICNYFLKIWEIKTFEPCLIKIPKIVYDEFNKSNENIDKRYNNFDFDKYIFFATPFIESSTELETYNTVFNNKPEFKKFDSPLDLIKIGIFDFWIANMDRRGSNPNILLTTSDNDKFVFLPIDHTQAFAYHSDYKRLTISLMESGQQKSLLSTPISKSIIKFADNKLITNLEADVIHCINETINGMDFVFSQVPSFFGLSQAGKLKIKYILSDKDRNIKISKLYLNYLK
jgi:hypothetical protein